MIQERIIQTLEKAHNIDQRKLSQVAGVNESSISRYLNGHEEINFEGILRIVKYLYPEQEKEIMAAYIPTQKSRNARYALEYCVMNSLWGLVKHLIDMLSASSNPVDKEWAAMYNLLLQANDKRLTILEQLNQIEIFKPREIEMRILKSIFKAYVYFDLEERYGIFLHIEGTDELLKTVKSTFIRDSFTIRLSLIMSYVYLVENDLEKSREYSTYILKQNFFEHVKGKAHKSLGVTYLFENYQKSSEHFHKAIDFFIHNNQPNEIMRINLNLSFLKSYWNVDYSYSQVHEDYRGLLNYIFYLIKKGESTLALEHINKIHVERLTKWDQAFYYYYLGLLTQNKTAYYRSVEVFTSLNDFFRIQLPIEELKKLGEDEVALRILASRRRK